MNKAVHQATVHISGSIDALTELRSILHTTYDSPHFMGDLLAVRDRYEEVVSIVDDLEEIRDYIENINLDF
jgi:hypothetical protein